ncbi:MAG: GNAT family acetyltransferase [Proteobacteria bacterium]|nr:GNAT family acetyltransferase [Pseudomonadota bacterium]
MGELVIGQLTEADVEPVVALWLACGLTRPWNDPRSDIAFARKGASSTVLVGRTDSKIAASVMVGHDGHRGWFYYLAVDPACQKRGFGRIMVGAAEQWLSARGIVKAMLMVRQDNTGVRTFYEKLGYFDQPRTILARWLDGREPTP